MINHTAPNVRKTFAVFLFPRHVTNPMRKNRTGGPNVRRNKNRINESNPIKINVTVNL
jgi:hypothetical protein